MVRVLLFVAGAIISVSGLIAPMHEVWHVIGADGNAEIQRWDYTWTNNPTIKFLLTGWYGEAFTLFLLFCLLPKKHAAFVPLGALHATAIMGPFSTDLTTRLISLLTNTYGLSIEKAHEVQSSVITTWAIVGSLVILAAWVWVGVHAAGVRATAQRLPA